MEYFAVTAEGVAASIAPSASAPPVPLLSGQPGHSLRVNFGAPLNLMEKCAARVQMQVSFFQIMRSCA